MKLIEKIQRFFKKEESQNKWVGYLCLLGAVGMLLVFLSDEISVFSSQKDKTGGESLTISSDKEKELEKRLEAILSQIDGAGKTRVMLTFATSEQYVYLTDSVEHFSKKEQ